MHNGDILILTGQEVQAALAGRELEVVEIVRKAYQAHALGESSLPHSTFLRFPADQKNRIIALPAYLGQEFGIAGLKWVASFPGNRQQNLDRASAVIVLNSPFTGRPETLLEGSIISAKRTAASAALAVQSLRNGHRANSAGLIGCGLINFEIVRFLQAVCPEVTRLIITDLSRAQAEHFKEKCRNTFAKLDVQVVEDSQHVLTEASLISFATTAAQPHISDLSSCAPGTLILHISLRDLAPEAILSCDNIVDDVDHVCGAQTSVHLAEQLTGSRDFIRCTLADILTGQAPTRRDAESKTVFSPFGLGILDLAVAKLVREFGLRQNQGTVIPSFLPDSWVERK